MATQLGGIIQTVQKDRDEFILLGFIALTIGYVFFESRDLLPGSRQVPLLIAVLMLIVLSATVVMKFFGSQLQHVLGWQRDETGFYLDAEVDGSEEDVEHLYDLNPLLVTKHGIWLVLYLGSLVYIGFWTTNIVFPFVYIMLYETSPLPRRFVYFVLWTGLIVGTLWILFVELLNVQAIWRLGFLP